MTRAGAGAPPPGAGDGEGDGEAGRPIDLADPSHWLHLLDRMDMGVALFDRQDRLVVCNAQFSALYPAIAREFQPGRRFEDLMRMAIAHGLVPEAEAQPEPWLANRLAQRRQPGQPTVRSMVDGRLRRISETRLPDGSLVMSSLDVTSEYGRAGELDAARYAAELATMRLEDALEALPAGFELWDRNDRLVIANSELRRMYPQVADRLVPGTPWEELVRANHRAGALRLPEGMDLDGYLAQRRLARRTPGEPAVHATDDGRWIRTIDRVTRDGGLAGIRIDVSELRRHREAADLAHADVEQAAQRLRDAIEALPEGFALFDAEDRLIAFNQRYVDIYRDSAQAIVEGARFEDLLRHGLARGQYPQALGREEAWLRERLLRHRQPGPPMLQELPGNRWLRIEERLTRDGGVAGVRTEITEMVRNEQALAESQARLNAVIVSAASPIVTISTDGRMVDVNPATERLFGYTRQELLGQNVSMLMDEPERSGHDGNLSRYLAEGQPRIIGTGREIRARHRDGEPLPLHLAVSEARTATSHVFVGVLTDLRERKRIEAELRMVNELLALQATTDELTGLTNRRRFEDSLASEWQRSARSGAPLSVLMVDVDHFKLYNDTRGHPAGDACLFKVAQLLRACARRAGEVVARYGGEEFILLLPDTSAAGARVVAERCLEELRTAALPHGASPVGPNLSVSIGIATSAGSTADLPASLVQRADAALYEAKKEGRDRWSQAA